MPGASNTTNEPVDDTEPEPDRATVQLRGWIEDQLRRAGVGDSAALVLSGVRGLDYRRVAHWKQLGMTDDEILDQYL